MTTHAVPELNPFCICCHKPEVAVRYYAHYERDVVACGSCGYVMELIPWKWQPNVPEHNAAVERLKALLTECVENRNGFGAFLKSKGLA